MSRLRRKLRRDLRQLTWRALAIVLTCASGVAVYVGTYTGLLSLYWTRDSIYRELHFADLEVRFLPDDTRNLPDFAAVDGVTHVERRLVLPGTMPRAGRPPLTTIMTFLETPAPAIHSFKVVAGRLFGRDETNAAVIDVGLATYHGRKVGDVIEVKVGEAVYRRHVVGIVITPEYFVSTSNPAYFIPEKGSVGFVFAHLDGIADALGFTLVNDAVLRFADGVDAADVQARVLARASKLNVQDVFTRDRHFAYRFVQSQLDGIRAFVPAIVLVLTTLTFIVVSINVSRMIATDRPQLGALMALGYRPSRLVRAYVEALVMLGLVGGVLGLGLSYAIRHLFATVCAASMGMPELRLTTDAATMARGVVYELIVVAVATALPVARLVRRSPHDVIRPAPPVARHAGARLERVLGRLLGPVPVGQRHAVRNLTRRRSRTVVTLLAIALGLGVATAYRLSVGALDTTLGRWLADETWDLAVDFLYPVPLERVQELDALVGVKRTEPFFTCYVELRAGDRVADASVLGLVPDSPMRRLKLAGGREFRAGPEREAVLSRDLSERLGLGLGDVFEVRSMTERYPVRLVGFNFAAVGRRLFTAFPVAQEVCQFPDKATGVYVQTGGGEPRLHDLDFVGKALSKRDLATQVRQLLSVMVVVLDLATAVAIFVGMLVVLTSISLSVLESERDFATLRALGYSRRLIGSIVLTEAGVSAVLAVALSIPVAIGTSLYLNDRMSAAWVRINSTFLPSAFLSVLLPGALLVPLGSLPALRGVVGRDIATSLGTRALE